MLNSLSKVSKRFVRPTVFVVKRNFCKNPYENGHEAQRAYQTHESKLLNVLNGIENWEMCRTILTAKHFELIQQRKTENGGSIRHFDDIAKIEGINKEIVENLREFCASQLACDAPNLDNHASIQPAGYVPGRDYIPNEFVENGNNFIIYDERVPPFDLTTENTNQNYTNGSSIPRNRFGKAKLFLEPKLRKTISIQSFTSCYQEAASLTVARFSANNWENDIKIDTWTHYKTATFGAKNLFQISEELAGIVDQLPASDIYIVDDHITAQRFRKSVTPKKLTEIVQINQQCAILAALLQHKQRRSTDKKQEPNVFSMGYQSVGQLFNLFVGNETISTQSTIKKILRGDFCSEAFNSSTIDVSDESEQAYHKSYSVERECLGRSMLIGLTFIRLGIPKAKSSTNT